VIMETTVERVRWCGWASDCHEAKRRQADACNDERQRQAHDQSYQRMRSGFNFPAHVIEGRKINFRAVLPTFMSGLLRFS